jgi:methyl-accepting chemotaxis protein
MTQENAALVEQSAAAAESLRGQADRLVHAVSLFKLVGHVNAAADDEPLEDADVEEAPLDVVA